MSDMSLNHDLYHDAHQRRRTEAHSRVRDQALQRSARMRSQRSQGPGARVRLIGLLARAMGVAEQIAPAQRSAASKHQH